MKLLNIIRMLYIELTTDLYDVGMPVASIELREGLRQGCPLIGTVFASALFPCARWYLMRPLFRAHIFLYADDLANALRDLYRLLPLPLHVLHHLSLASGLTLEPSKCVVRPLREGDYTELIRVVSSLPRLTADTMHTSAR